MISFELLLGLVSILAGAIATVTGFGVGSLLTPLLAMTMTTKLAVAAVALPHLVGSAVRMWVLRQHLDRRLLWSFGLMSALGGLTGALLHAFLDSSPLRILFGLLLFLAGVMGVTGMANRIRLSGQAAWIAGGVSGMLGGLAGTQGGIRAAALYGFNVSKETFVATATAVGLLVDLVRVPIYVANQWSELILIWPLIGVATLNLIVGTVGGQHVLKAIPESAFRRVISVVLMSLGVHMVFVQKT